MNMGLRRLITGFFAVLACAASDVGADDDGGDARRWLQSFEHALPEPLLTGVLEEAEAYHRYVMSATTSMKHGKRGTVWLPMAVGDDGAAPPAAPRNHIEAAIAHLRGTTVLHGSQVGRCAFAARDHI